MSKKIDSKAHVGYYSEFKTAEELAKIIIASGGKLRTPLELVQTLIQEKQALLYSLEKPSVLKEMERVESAARILAQQLFRDIRVPGAEYEVELTGDSEKGKSKSDLVLIVYDSNGIEVDRINASLKAYKGTNYNLANNTYTSFFAKLFEDTTEIRETDDFRRLLELQRIIQTLIASGMSKDQARKESKKTHLEVTELIARIFSKHYPSCKESVNRRLLSLLGLDSSGDFYGVFGETPNNQVVLSSRQSEPMKRVLQRLQNEFVIRFENDKQIKNTALHLSEVNGEDILVAKVTFTDTGGNKPDCKTNCFVNFKNFFER